MGRVGAERRMRSHIVPEMIQARALTGFPALVEDHGADPRTLLRECGIPAAALDDPDLPIPLDGLAALYEHAASRLALDDFGLRLSARQDLSIYGSLALIVLHSPTVGEALQRLVRHFSFHTPGARISIGDGDEPDHLCVSYVLDLAPGTPCRQIIEQSYGMAAKLWAAVAPAGADAPRILLRHSPAMDPAVYRGHFGCRCDFGQAIDAILLPRSALGLAVEQADPRLLESAERFVVTIMRRHPLDLGKQVEALVAEQLAFGGAAIDRVAGQLKMHRRQLQRHLARQGLHFETIVDAVRRFRAEDCLRNTGMPLAGIAAMLGYNEQSSFNRACRRWFGATPLRVREG